jgi:hypothetical protein
MGVVVSVVAAVLGSLVAAASGAPEEIAITIGAVVFLIALAVLSFVSQRAFFTHARTMPARFPSDNSP